MVCVPASVSVTISDFVTLALTKAPQIGQTGAILTGATVRADRMQRNKSYGTLAVFSGICNAEGIGGAQWVPTLFVLSFDPRAPPRIPKPPGRGVR